MRSSPVTTPIRARPPTPARRPASATARAHSTGFTPPALVTTPIPRSAHATKIRSIKGTKSRAYPAFGSRDLCFCMIDIVTSAR